MAKVDCDLCIKINWEEEDEKMTLGSVVFPSPPTFKVSIDVLVLAGEFCNRLFFSHRIKISQVCSNPVRTNQKRKPFKNSYTVKGRVRCNFRIHFLYVVCFKENFQLHSEVPKHQTINHLNRFKSCFSHREGQSSNSDLEVDPSMIIDFIIYMVYNMPQRKLKASIH